MSRPPRGYAKRGKKASMHSKCVNADIVTLDDSSDEVISSSCNSFESLTHLKNTNFSGIVTVGDSDDESSSSSVEVADIVPDASATKKSPEVPADRLSPNLDDSSSSTESCEDEHKSRTEEVTEKLAVRRGINLSDDELDSSILPQAAIFSSCIAQYRKAINFKPTIKDVEAKCSSTEDKDDTKGTKSDHSADDETDGCSPDKMLKKSEIVSAEVKAKLNRIRRNIQKDRMKNKRLCNFTLPVEPVDDDEDDSVFCLQEEDDDRETTVKIRCRAELLRFTIKRNEKFVQIFMELAKKYNVNASKIMLCHEDVTVGLEDTPAKLKLGLADILDCCLWRSETANSNTKQDWINIKIQAKDASAKREIALHKLDPLSVLMKKYSEMCNIPVEKMMFLFDGEKINPTDNSIDLELEDGHVIDVRIL